MNRKAESTTLHQHEPRLLYDRKSAARQLSISVRSLDYLIVRGSVGARRIGSRVLIPHEELVKAALRDHAGLEQAAQQGLYRSVRPSLRQPATARSAHSAS